MTEQTLDLNEYIEIKEGVYWVGFADLDAGLHCNPYLIVDHDEAVLLDSGSRNDFSTVMLKVLRTGINPNNIQRLIYHHYDPDLCSNIPHMEALIQNPNLQIISHTENNIFINYYSAQSPKLCIEQLGFCYCFSSGRELRFIFTPYAHSPGSFMTYDTKTKVLFSSDIFGSYDHNWSLYTSLSGLCTKCEPTFVCSATEKKCPLFGIQDFHCRIMTSHKALNYALDRIEELDISVIAPQHGSILHTPEAQKVVIEHLRKLTHVGIDHFLEEYCHENSTKHSS